MTSGVGSVARAACNCTERVGLSRTRAGRGAHSGASAPPPPPASFLAMHRPTSLTPRGLASAPPGPRGRRALAAASASAHPSTIVTPQTIVIAGGGIAGAATALALHRTGTPFALLERTGGLRAEGSAIGTWTNAWRALDALGVGDGLRERWPALERIKITKGDGSLIRTWAIADCGDGNHESRLVMRADLVDALAAPLPRECVAFNARVVAAATVAGRGATVTLADGTVLPCRAVIGADGIGSAVAAGLGKGPGRLRYAGYVAVRGVADFGSPAAVPASIPCSTVSFVYGNGARAGAIPLGDGRVYWFTVANAPEPPLGRTPPDVCRATALGHAAQFSGGVPVADLVRASPDATLSRAAVSDAWPAAASRWGAGAVTLAGDAAHPMTPNLGQGGCVALEDAVVLGRCLRRARPGDFDATVAALDAYERTQSTRARAVAIKSAVIGAAAQLGGPIIPAVRDVVLGTVYPVAHFLDHADYDCGTLTAEAAA